MARLALALYLSLVSIAGPWLCCCAGTRLTLRVRPEAPQPASACPHCAEHASPAPSEAPARPAEDSPCPCRELADHLTTLPPQSGGETLSDASSTPWAADALIPLALVAPPSQVDLFAHPAQALPFHPGGDFLRAFHRLRC